MHRYTAERAQLLWWILGESVVLAAHKPTLQSLFYFTKTFGESGTPAQLMDKYGLNSDAIEKPHKV
jgi:transketolase